MSTNETTKLAALVEMAREVIGMRDAVNAAHAADDDKRIRRSERNAAESYEACAPALAAWVLAIAPALTEWKEAQVVLNRARGDMDDASVADRSAARERLYRADTALLAALASLDAQAVAP